ncbi:MAG: GAF domain-containing protein [Candidatus Rokubacteria bacterium]|nr:GAF domain-containing protein [Candidatus Rokubacteria bacterium]
MGGGHDEPPEAPPRGRAALKKRSARGPGRHEAGRRPPSSPAARAQQARLAALLEISAKITALTPPEPLLRTIAEAAAQLLGADSVGFRLVDGDDLVLAGIVGPERDTSFLPRIRIGDSLAGRVVSENRSVAVPIDDVTDVIVPEHLAFFRRRGYTHFLGVPVRAGSRLVGVLSVRAARSFTPDDVALAETFAAQAAVALENARLYDEAERARQQAEGRARRLAALTAVTRLMTSAPDREKVFDAVAVAATALLGAKMARIWVADPVARVLRARGGHGIDARAERAMTDFRDIPFGRGVVGAVFESGQPQHVADVQEDARWHNQRLARHAGLHGYVGFPLTAGGRTLGVLSILFGERRPWDEESQELGTLLASHAAVAISNIELYEAVEVRASRLTTLARLSRLVSSSLDGAAVLRGIASAAAELVKAPLVHIWLADETERTLEIVASSDGRTTAAPSMRVGVGEGAAGLVATRREALGIDDVTTDDRFVNREWARREGFRSFYGVPIVLEDELLGVLALIGREPFRFGPDDHELLDTFVAHAAVAIRNARLYREAREYAERLRALESVNRLVSSSLNVEEVLANVARAAARFFDAASVSVWSFDAAARRLHRAFFHGDPEIGRALHTELALGEGIVGWCVLHRQPIMWADAADDERVIDGQRLVARGLRYFTAFPVGIGERILGAFVVYRATPARMPGETASLLGSLAAQAAVALDHARLYSETTRRLEETAALLEVAEILGSTLESRQLLKRVAMKVAQVCRVDRCSVERWDGDRVVPVMSQFADGRHRPELWEAFHRLTPHSPRSVPAHARAIETRRAVVIDDVAATDEIPRQWAEVFGLKSYLAVPLVVQDRVIGVMSLDYCARPTRFEQWQVDLATTIAGQFALAIENTRLYEEARTRLRETSTLVAVGRALSEPGPVEEVMRRVGREVGLAFEADSVGAYLVDERRESLVGIAGYRVPPELRAHFASRPLVLNRLPALASAWREGRAVHSSHPFGDPRFDQEWLRGLPDHSVVFASATAHGEPVGALFLVWWRPGRVFKPAELRLLEAVARQVGLAMDNAELARQREVRLRETEALLSVSRALGSTLDLPSLLRHLLRQVMRTIDADTVGVWILAADGESLEPLAGYRVPPDMRDAARTMRPSIVSDPFYAEAARTRRAVVSHDVASDARIPESVKRSLPHRSQLFVPIVVNERMIGGFAALWLSRARTFAEGELALMEAIANPAGVAIENARLFHENRRQLDELRALHDLSRAVTGELDTKTLLEAVYAQVGRVLGVRHMFVLLRAESRDGLEVGFAVHDGVPDTTTPRPHLGERTGLAPIIMRTGRAIRTEDYVAECRRLGVEPAARAVTMPRWLGVPMRARDTILGAMVVRSADRSFSEADERLLANIADLAALALRSAALYEERTRAYQELEAAQDQLVRTEKLRALGEMASGVAHDFNNLLAAILGRAQLALRDAQDAKLRHWLEVIERAALDGAKTVRRLQDFTRIRRDEPFVPIDLNEIVRDALDMTQARWREEPQSRGIRVDVRADLGDVPAVAGDAAELREALTNLILNAVDAMPHGGTLTLETGPVAGGVELQVRDTGVGMPDSVRGRVFDPFFTTKGPRGTGLGLSITYGILSRHGVVIALDSEEGRGTTFRLLFAAVAEVAAAGPQPAVAGVEPGPTLTCLVVDDDEAVGTVIVDMIEASGHRAVLLHGGAAAIARFRAEPFHVVFTDLAMPGLSGWDVARAVKDCTTQVPVFMVTGFGVELPDDSRREHVDGVLGKPLRMEDVVEALGQAQRYRRQSH